jgi:hypothetical protein
MEKGLRKRTGRRPLGWAGEKYLILNSLPDPIRSAGNSRMAREN